MAIQSGTRLGPFEILSAIGAGRTGEVYYARDSKLVCDVAIKVLREAFFPAMPVGRLVSSKPLKGQDKRLQENRWKP